MTAEATVRRRQRGVVKYLLHRRYIGDNGTAPMPAAAASFSAVALH